MKLYILRHGQSEGNVSGQGGLDPALTEVGINQVKMAGDRLKSVNIDVIYCSPLYRAMESAELVRNLLGKTPKIHPCFSEVWGANWKARTVEELQKKFTWAAFPEAMNTDRWWPLEAESIEQIHVRAQEALDLIEKNHAENNDKVLLVGHANLASAMIHLLSGAPLTYDTFFTHRNGSISLIDWNGSVREFVYINDVTHLPPIFWT